MLKLFHKRQMTISTTDRLLKLREQMARHKINAYIIPSEDAHQVSVTLKIVADW